MIDTKRLVLGSVFETVKEDKFLNIMMFVAGVEFGIFIWCLMADFVS